MMDVGNIYTGALFAWLAAGIEQALEERSSLAGEEILLVGYGSGDASEAIPVRLVADWAKAAAKIGFARALSYQVDLTQEQYRQLHHDGYSPGLTYDHREEFLIEGVGQREEKDFIDFGIEYYGYRGQVDRGPTAG
jgi:hydroxymethylglutaryl-CoA synthase